MNRRAGIAMTPAEVAAFLDGQQTVVCATIGPRGWPHLMPLWYVVRDGELWTWTYAKSQKVVNLERDDRATLQIEAGAEYGELRGVMIEAHAVMHRDLDAVAEIGGALLERFGRGMAADEPAVAAVKAQAAKRVALQFVPVRVVSWDHRKLTAAG